MKRIIRFISNEILIARLAILFTMLSVLVLSCVSLSLPVWISKLIVFPEESSQSQQAISTLKFKLSSIKHSYILGITTKVDGSVNLNQIDASSDLSTMNDLIICVVVFSSLALLSLSSSFFLKQWRTFLGDRNPKSFRILIVGLHILVFCLSLSSNILIKRLPSELNAITASIPQKEINFIHSINCGTNQVTLGNSTQWNAPEVLNCDNIWIKTNLNSTSSTALLIQESGSGWWTQISATILSVLALIFILDSQHLLFLTSIPRKHD